MAAPPVAGPGRDHDQALALEGAQQAREVARVEPEAAPQLAHLPAVGPDLPQHARRAQGPVASEEALVEGADALADGSVEAPHPGDHLRIHCLTLVR